MRNRLLGASLQGAALWVTLGATALIAASLAVAVVSLIALPQGAVRADGDVAGVVTLLNDNRTSLCLTEERGGPQLCTDFVVARGTSAPAAGLHVAGTLLLVPQQGVMSQVLVVTEVSKSP